MSCDPEEMCVLADAVKDLVESYFPYYEYEDFLEEQHGKGRLNFKLDPNVRPGRIEVEISCRQLIRSLNVKLIRSNTQVEAKEFSRSGEEAGKSSEGLLADLKKWLQSL